MFLSLKIVFVLAKIKGPDEMPHNAAFHLSLHCLSQSMHLGITTLQRVNAGADQTV